LTFLGRIKARYPSLPVILMTAWGSISLAVRGIQSGAVDFIVKPWNNRQLLQTVKTALALADTSFSSASMDVPNREALDTLGDFHDIIGRDPKLLRILAIISATNRNLAEMVNQGCFREDLLYRLNLIAMHLPALRERSGDIPLLAQHFLNEIGRMYRRNSLSIRPEAMNWLQTQPWPGNIRQLKHIMERTVLIGSQDHLNVNDFQNTISTEIIESTGRNPLPEVGSMTLEEMERAMIDKALQHHAGNISRAAESLGMTRTSLYRRIEKYGIRF